MSAMTSALGASVGALIGSFASPWVQHRFWRRQREEERQWATIDEVHRLAAEFQDYYIKAYYSQDVRVTPRQEFLQALSATETHVRTLFSQETFQAYKRMEQLIGRPHPGQQLQPLLDAFIQARDAALDALRQEVGRHGPSWEDTLRQHVWQPLQ
jgi:hypothetical protein